MHSELTTLLIAWQEATKRPKQEVTTRKLISIVQYKFFKIAEPSSLRTIFNMKLKMSIKKLFKKKKTKKEP